MKKNPKVSQWLQITLCILLVVSFGLWVLAYSNGATATPPAALVFGPERLPEAKEAPFRVLAVDTLKKQRFDVVGFEILSSTSSLRLPFKGDEGRAAIHSLKTENALQISLNIKDFEFPLIVPIQFSTGSKRAFDGFRWHALEDDYAEQLNNSEMSFYPLWGNVSSSLNNVGFWLENNSLKRINIPPHPATVRDLRGNRLVLDRSGYDLLGPLAVTPGKEAKVQIRCSEARKYYLHSWLNEHLIDMIPIYIEEGKRTMVFDVPPNAKPDDVFWFSITGSPWLRVQGKAFMSRVSSKASFQHRAHMKWLQKVTEGAFFEDPLRKWILSHPDHADFKDVWVALQSRVRAPFFQAPIVSPRPKEQLLTFEKHKEAQVKKWRFPFRICSVFFCLFVLIWVRQEVRSHLLWKKELEHWGGASNEPIPQKLKWSDRIPWHNLWGILAFIFICGLIWATDWVLGLTLNDYQF